MKGLFELDAADVSLKLASDSREGVLGEFAAKLAAKCQRPGEQELLKLLLERESLGSTGIGDGVALPHCTSPALTTPVILFGRSDRGIDFQAVDGKPVFLFFVIVTPEGDAAIHLKLLSRISRLLKSADIRKRLFDAEYAEEIVTIMMDNGSVRCLQ